MSDQEIKQAGATRELNFGRELTPGERRTVSMRLDRLHGEFPEGVPEEELTKLRDELLRQWGGGR